MEFRYAFLTYMTVPNVCLIWVICLKSFGILYHHLWYKYSRLILWLLLAFLTSSRKTGQFPFYWPDFSWWKHFPSLLMSPWVSIHFPLVFGLTINLWPYHFSFLSLRGLDRMDLNPSFCVTFSSSQHAK